MEVSVGNVDTSNKRILPLETDFQGLPCHGSPKVLQSKLTSLPFFRPNLRKVC